MSKTAQVKETPLMRQHNEIKSKYPDAILLFRVGDFYETFGQDAVIASTVLGITLTKRANGAAAYIELAGFPYHSLDTYLHKLVKAGYRVAICDQLEDPKMVKGIVKRGVTELVTPGVATNDKLLDHNSNNFLAAVHITEQRIGVCFLDISTGELYAAEGDWPMVDRLIQSFAPAEILIAKQQKSNFHSQMGKHFYTYAQEDWIFQHQYTYELIQQHFEVINLKGFGIEDWKYATVAIGAAIHYLKDTQHPNLQHITQIQRINESQYVWMDKFTIRNLELLQNSFNQDKNLYDSINFTATPMGARMLKHWMLFPLCNMEAIESRQNVVRLFNQRMDLGKDIQVLLKQIGDVERLISKIPLRKVNPRELIQLKRSLSHMNTIAERLNEVHLIESTVDDNSLRSIQQIVSDFQNTEPAISLIEACIQEEAPAVLNKGNVIKEEYNHELDELRHIAYKGKDYLLQIQQREIEVTGIPSLKIGFNNVFGYYLEVTHTHKDKVPDTWIRKQTLTSAERYITPELKEYEDKILGAEEKIQHLEATIYQHLLDQLMAYILPVQQNSKCIAMIDCLLSFSLLAVEHKYCQPSIIADKKLHIEAGRHPVIEMNLPIGTPYIPNDVHLNDEDQQIMIITGPNMSGKSAVLRQVAIITLMAHMGSYIPATSATIPLTDIIYTRVGASDNLSGGESTFMVEMNETASILNNLSARSLVILDEIGRGTSTYDGISIAWSIVEYIHNHDTKPFTLFATHYHELNELENRLSRVKNFHITHQETKNKVIFLRKLKAGGSHHSFGIQVAKMAGMPKKLTERADELLKVLEAQRNDDPIKEQIKNIPTHNYQLNIFDSIGEDLKTIKEKLFEVDINTLTPVEALLKLNEMKEIVKQYNV